MNCGGDSLGDCLLNSLGGILHGGGDSVEVRVMLVLDLNVSGELNCKKVGDLC